MNSKKMFTIIGIVAAIAAVLLIVFLGKGSDYSRNNGIDNDLSSYERDDLIISPAIVSGVSVTVLESFPVQVRVTAEGMLSNGCQEIYETLIQQNENVFNVTLNAAQPEDDAVCTEALRPFTETFALDVRGLVAGTYTVDVNGVTDTFVLAVDNVLDFESSRDK